MEFIFNEDGTISVRGIKMRNILFPDFANQNPNFNLKHYDEELHNHLLSLGINSKTNVYVPKNGGEEEVSYNFKVSFGHFGKLYLYTGNNCVEITEKNGSELLDPRGNMIRLSDMKIKIRPRPYTDQRTGEEKITVNLVKGSAYVERDEFDEEYDEYLRRRSEENYEE